MHPASRAVRGVSLLVVLLAAATGCGVVRMEPPTPDAHTAKLCRSMMARLPDTLYEQERIRVEPDSELVAAWGSPTIAVRCGGASRGAASRLATAVGQRHRVASRARGCADPVHCGGPRSVRGADPAGDILPCRRSADDAQRTDRPGDSGPTPGRTVSGAPWRPA